MKTLRGMQRRLRSVVHRATRPSTFIAIAGGAYLGMCVGAMFDNILHPGAITAIGAGIGGATGLLALARLHSCVPSASYWG